MAVPSRDLKSPYLRVLDKARELAEQVRETAERVHQQALEAHRLTEIARRHCDRGRELSKTGREEACSIKRSIGWSIETALAAEHRLSSKKAD